MLGCNPMGEYQLTFKDPGKQADHESTALNVTKTNKAAFLERYQLDFRDENTIEGALARDLFIALKRLAKDFGLSFNMNSVQQFSNDLETIRQAPKQRSTDRTVQVTRRLLTTLLCRSDVRTFAESLDRVFLETAR